jgi:hypothetical protein
MSFDSLSWGIIIKEIGLGVGEDGEFWNMEGESNS